ncbi:proteasome assembly chaperone 2 [Phtheirospermum japonicum]|uniref:Proteasome assembly chaperone 2 n=1 Tax=Phtheirospermum japonicum TaxID=374723 RepID=A0A830BTM8_9LAMI|nr:proteasome assembly chaperone 2 [Phtheirospermum japonicum]
MEFHLEEGKKSNPKCSTLILPALSIGNVGQLAVDLLISSLKADKIGCLDDPNVLPCVGNDAYSPSPLGKLALPLEAYESSSSALTLVQQRSPVIKGMTIEYAKNMANFAAANEKKHVVILSSLDFGRWRNINMSSGLQIYYLSSSNVDGTDSECESLGWNRLQDYDPAQRTWKHLDALAEEGSMPDEDFPIEELGDEDYYPSLPFAALFSCFKAKGLKVTCLLCYCSEGDNIPEAFSMAEAASRLTGLSDNGFKGEIILHPQQPFYCPSQLSFFPPLLMCYCIC